jgi:hypothetical protein
MFDEIALSRVRCATNPLVLTSKIGNMGNSVEKLRHPEQR